MVKARNPKLAERIAEPARKDLLEAEMLAIRGRQFTQIEELLYGFWQKIEVQKIKSAKS